MITPAGYLLRERGEFGGSDLPILTVVSEYGVRIRDLEAGGRAIGKDLAGYRRVRQGDLVVNRLWARFGAYGVSEFDGLISPAYWILQPDSSKVDGRFLHSLLRSSRYLAEIRRLSKDMPPNGFDLPWDLFKRMHLTLPSLPKQRAIADYLDTETARIDALIQKKQRMIEMLDERWAASRHEAVLRGVNPLTGSGTIPVGWDCPQLGVAIKLQRGHDLPFESRRDGRIPVVSSGGISGYHDEPACQGPAVVTGRYGTVGDVYFIEEPCWPLNTTLYVTDFCGNYPRWVAYLLESIPLDAESEKSAVGGINRNVIGKLRIPRPPLDEQVMLANSLLREQLKHRKARELLVAQHDLLLERRQSLITAAVTGDLEIPGVTE
jgi:type I restriction enzyme S subunit